MITRVVRALAIAVVLSSGCGPVGPASERVPISGGDSTSYGDEGTQPGSDAPIHDDGAATEPKLDHPGGDDDGWSCPRMATIEPLASAIEVIVDVSQAMDLPQVDHDFDAETPPIARWTMLRTALDEALPALAEDAEVALRLFPRVDAPPPLDLGACEVGPGLELGTPVDELLAALPAGDVDLRGANPMAAAIEAAHRELAEVDDARRKVIVVLADSAPNCDTYYEPPVTFDIVDDDARGWVEYAMLFDDVRTHVVAIAVPDGNFGGGYGDPYANHNAVLQSIANAGGSGLAIAFDAPTLDAHLASIVAQTRSCRARIPDDLLGAWFTIEVAGQEFYETGFGACSGTDGFVVVDNARYDTLELCGTACTLFVAEQTATLWEQCAIPE